MSPALLLALCAVQAPATAIQVFGHVEVQVGGVSTPLARFAEVPERATVVTHENSSATLRLTSGSLLRMGPGTHLVLDQLEQRTPAAARKEGFTIKVGRVWARVMSLVGDDSKFTVSSDNAVAGVRGTAFWVATGPDGEQFIVDSGSVLVSPRATGAPVLLDRPGASTLAGVAGVSPATQLSAAALEALRRSIGSAAAGIAGQLLGGGLDGNHDGSRRDLLPPGSLIDSFAGPGATGVGPADAARDHGDVVIRLHVP